MRRQHKRQPIPPARLFIDQVALMMARQGRFGIYRGGGGGGDRAAAIARYADPLPRPGVIRKDVAQ